MDSIRVKDLRGERLKDWGVKEVVCLTVEFGLQAYQNSGSDEDENDGSCQDV